MNYLAAFLLPTKYRLTKPIKAMLLVGLVSFSIQVYAATLSPESADFLASQLQGNPKPQYLWLTAEVKKQTLNILDHPYSKLRVPYWQAGETGQIKTLWILEEIGKHQPITVGIVIINQQIESLRILNFRESRGWEVKLPGFTRQFDGMALKKSNDSNNTELTGYIDGISGATLSVNAVTKLSKLALLLQQHVEHKPIGSK